MSIEKHIQDSLKNDSNTYRSIFIGSRMRNAGAIATPLLAIFLLSHSVQALLLFLACVICLIVSYAFYHAEMKLWAVVLALLGTASGIYFMIWFIR